MYGHAYYWHTIMMFKFIQKNFIKRYLTLSQKIRYYVKVCMHNEFAASFNRAMQQNTEYPTVTLIASCKINFSKTYNITYLTNTQASKFYLNCNIKRMYILRKRYVDYVKIFKRNQFNTFICTFLGSRICMVCVISITHTI